jgi:hypothetical protein
MILLTNAFLNTSRTYKIPLSRRYFICPICIKDSHGQLGFLYVLLVLMTVMVNKVLYMSYLYKGQSWSVRYCICLTCIKEIHGE